MSDTSPLSRLVEARLALSEVEVRERAGALFVNDRDAANWAAAREFERARTAALDRLFVEMIDSAECANRFLKALLITFDGNILIESALGEHLNEQNALLARIRTEVTRG